MFYITVSEYKWVCRERSGIDSKNLKKFEESLSSNKKKRERRKVKKAVARRQQLELKREKRPTGRIIYQNGIATREMK